MKKPGQEALRMNESFEVVLPFKKVSNHISGEIGHSQLVASQISSLNGEVVGREYSLTFDDPVGNVD